MSEEYKAGMIDAYSEMKAYTDSMITTKEKEPDLIAWLDMSFYALTSIDELENDCKY
jgi:hypothetical protein